VIVNKDPAGFGFKDPTVAAPVGGNAGTTLGQQRLNVFQAAANIWGAKLASPVTINIAAQWASLTPCTTTSGVLGSAGPTAFFANFPNAPRMNTWYPVALASALSGTDMSAGRADDDAITARFNIDVGTGTCLPSTGWYLGLDGNHGGLIDLEAVLLHEFGHGLGFTALTNLQTGVLPSNLPDIFSVFTFDNTTLMHWDVMSAAQRVASAVNTGHVVFDGTTTTAASSILTAGKDASGHPLLYAPNPLQLGSSISHFDTSASPNQLMEPAINGDLTHNVDVPNDLTTKVMRDLGWPSPCVVGIPASFTATAASSTSVGVTWNSAACATAYHLYRSANGTTFTRVGGEIAGTSFTDSTAAMNTAYLYKVRAFDGTTESTDSNVDLATTVIPTNPVTIGASVQALDFTQIRTAVNAVETLAGVANTAYTDATLDSTVTIKAAHINEPLARLNFARGKLGLSTIALSGGAIVQFATPVRASDINDLRAGVQ
jgi:hypothetical protein